jgi:uncharacterized protein YndB with AHSA1/START domain
MTVGESLSRWEAEAGRRRTNVIRIEESVEINRPVEEVFSYATNPENFSEWVGNVIEVRKDASGPLREGETFTAEQKLLGRRFEAPFEVIAYEPNRRYAHRSTGGPAPVTMNFTYEPVSSESTRITQRNEGEPGGFFGLVGPLLQRALRRQVRTNLENLKDMLEARGQPQR